MKRKTSGRGSDATSGQQPKPKPPKKAHRQPESPGAGFADALSAAAAKSGPKWLPFAITAAGASLGAAILLLMTNWGVGTTTDSTIYISVARNFLQGYGLSSPPGTPLTHYPPLYPVVLALSGLWGQDPLDGARWLHALMFFATLALSGFIIYRETQGSRMALATGLLVLLTSNTLIYVCSFAWSEALFILLSLAGFLLLKEYLKRPAPLLLVSASLTIGCAVLTRYAGISLVIAACLCIALLSRQDAVKRAFMCLSFGIVAVLPVSLWVLRNRLVAGTLTDRSLVSHPLTWQHVSAGIQTISSWLLMPQAWGPGFRIFVLAVFAGTVFAVYRLLFRAASKTEASRSVIYFPTLFIVFLFSYLIFLGFSISCIDAHTPLDNRILSPVYAVGVIALVSIAYHAWIYYKKRADVAIALLCVGALFLMGQAFQSAPLISTTYSRGSGFLSKAWKSAPIIGLVQSLPADLVIFTNGPDPIEFLTGKRCQMLPAKAAADTGLANPNFAAQSADMIRQIHDGTAILVYFNGTTGRWYLPSKQEITGNLRVPALYEGWDGVILGAKQ